MSRETALPPLPANPAEEFRPFVGVIITPPAGWRAKTEDDVPLTGVVIEVMRDKFAVARYENADIAHIMCAANNRESMRRGNITRWAVAVEHFGEPAVGAVVSLQRAFRVIEPLNPDDGKSIVSR